MSVGEHRHISHTNVRNLESCPLDVSRLHRTPSFQLARRSSNLIASKNVTTVGKRVRLMYRRPVITASSSPFVVENSWYRLFSPPPPPHMHFLLLISAQAPGAHPPVQTEFFNIK
jgi:hypothetical protein